ncbi:protein SCO1 homolog 2, mitochondrial isoform X1 [Amborella trichopoda]|uniref:protein SCO1 homolog 2, mitochondrial isoform X1 n=2 Tax=Amborella trichopoda TaxID=13333 RepID=UPI0009C065D8|nr:protein SCO1 homolog 2, mitochondrial isoform X1 [Amborella trichopoda]|eukprot:XP_011621331.2 protein SCO1 homolog 2, mitochondrial isoform X1 [Amborella trichopoda]
MPLSRSLVCASSTAIRLCFRSRSRDGVRIVNMHCSFWNFQSCGYSTSHNFRREKPKQLNPLPDKSHSRSWSDYIVPVAFLMVAGAGVAIHYNDERRATPKGAGGAAKTISRPAVGGPFKLVNTNNQIVTDRDFRGNWTLLYFGYTSSPDVDPMEIQKMVRAIDVLEKEHNMKVNLVFITLDPERDSPWHLRAYLKEFDPKIVGLTGPIDAIRQVAHEYRVFFKRVGEDNQDYLVESSHNLYLMDPNMEPVKLFGVEYDAEQLCYDILQGIKSVSGSCAK